MYKIKNVAFLDHPVLGNLRLDFCGPDGKAVDTVILAGENGSGKSTVIDALYQLTMGKNNSVGCQVSMEVEFGESLITVESIEREHNAWDICACLDNGQWVQAFMPDYRNTFDTHAIYSDVDINFHSGRIGSTTSLDVDSSNESRRSTSALSNEINQLLVDVRALDSEAVNDAALANPDLPAKELPVERRMSRFTSAFEFMFDDLKFGRIENKDNAKAILFKKGDSDIPIESLSSGEKQVVYRGCFLLKDANATNGAFVYIDEPEISLHPKWQKKIVDYYKSIFTDSRGVQSSQIFIVTHSPFILHNENRRNDKVIVLHRGDDGGIYAEDKPCYYRCDAYEAVEDAFSVNDFSISAQYVYVEGETDEMYLQAAADAYGKALPFRFKQVGYTDGAKQAKRSGSGSLKAAANALVAMKWPVKCACLFDGDTNHKEVATGNVYELSWPTYDNSAGMKKGIENALVLDDVNCEAFYRDRLVTGDYGKSFVKPELDKMELCKHICSLDADARKAVFANFPAMFEKLLAFFEG